MMQKFAIYAPAVLFVFALLLPVFWNEPVDWLTSIISEGSWISYFTYVLLLVGAVVLMPITVLPLIPLASAVLGPLPTALLSILGWTVGSVIAFLLARRFGRPLLSRFISLQAIDRIGDSLPPQVRFLGIILLRNTLPVDIVSYALGLSTSIGILEYTLATAIGVSWFSFAFAFAGEALLSGNKPLLIELVGISLVIFLGGWYFLKRSRRKDLEQDADVS